MATGKLQVHFYMSPLYPTTSKCPAKLAIAVAKYATITTNISALQSHYRSYSVVMGQGIMS